MAKIPGVFRSATTVREFPAGAVIFEEGSHGEEMYGVIEGEVEVRTPSGHVHTLGPDETFGEMGIIYTTSTRSATAVAATDVKLSVIDRKTFLFLVHETPMFALQVMASIADRLRAQG
jgi:CRP-like cAMP-binding protein